jgi:hypothetical protein
MSFSCVQENTFGNGCIYMILLYISLSKTLLENKGDFWKHFPKVNYFLRRGGKDHVSTK